MSQKDTLNIKKEGLSYFVISFHIFLGLILFLSTLFSLYYKNIEILMWGSGFILIVLFLMFIKYIFFYIKKTYKL